MNQYLLVEWENTDKSDIGFFVADDNKILDRIDFDDCYPGNYEVYYFDKIGMQFKKARVYGCWHNPREPLYIKIEDQEGNILFDGYGTDH